MIVVADARILVAELLRPRGRTLITNPSLSILVTEEQWSETQHELERRTSVVGERGHLTPDWVALAIALNAGILTSDHDFFGCGCPAWTTETLRAELPEG